MRIYHKKNFWAGLGMAALGILNLALSLWRRDFDLSTGILVGALLLLGVSSLLRSLSPKFSREDKIEERDVYLAMKSSRAAMGIFNKVLFLTSVLSLWLYVKFDVAFLLPVGVTLSGAVLFLFLLLLCVNLYYEKRG